MNAEIFGHCSSCANSSDFEFTMVFSYNLTSDVVMHVKLIVDVRCLDIRNCDLKVCAILLSFGHVNNGGSWNKIFISA